MVRSVPSVVSGFTLPEPDESTRGTLVLAPGVSVPRDRVRIEFSRSSGPGGQNVNKLSTRCQLRIAVDDIPIHPDARLRLAALAGHQITASNDLLIDCESERSQSRNRDECFAKLRDLIVRAMVRPKPRRKTKPTRGSVERRLGEKNRRSEIKKGREGGRGDE